MITPLRQDAAPTLRAPRRGAALVLTLLISIAIAGMAIGAVIMASTSQGSTKFTAKEAALQAAADGGLEIIRDSLNHGIFDSLLPDSSYTVIAQDAPVLDAAGHAMGDYTRSLYVGRTGGRTGGAATAGQYGSNFASAVSIISNARGAVAARRLLLTQESWAKFAVAINNWSSTSYYGCGESVVGAVHSNNQIRLQPGCTSPKTLFAGPVSVVTSIVNQSSGDYRAGVQTGVTPVPWPTPARISLMEQYAQEADAGGDYDLTSLTLGSVIPGLHVEFLVVDMNGDGVIGWDEGFMRVWYPANLSDTVLAYATGRRWPTGPGGTAPLGTDPNMVSRNCGAVTQIDGTGPTQFFTAQQIYDGTTGATTVKQAAVRAALTSGTRRCYLGGDPHLFTTTTGDSLTPDSLVTNTPAASNQFGFWRKRSAGVFGPVATARPGDAAYLIPLEGNPEFKGVVFIHGDVAISGRLRGRVSVFATGNVVLADDILYMNAPGSKCDAEGDILGAIATKDVVIEDNSLQSPLYVNGIVYGGFDDSSDENYNAFLFAAGSGAGDGNWYGEMVKSPWTASPPGNLRKSYWATSTFDASARSQTCGDAANGCVRVSGGIAEGRLDNATYNGGNNYGWGEAHSYDPCGAVNPPPYFPTTGRFTASRYYELDPVWLRHLTIPDYFARLRSQ